MNETDRQRLFFALWPSPELARQLHQLARDAFEDPRARVLQAAQIHLTLIYLGPSERRQRECAEAVAARVAAEPFQLDLTALGYWPRPRVGWIAPAQSPPALDSLVSQLQQGLPACGYVMETRPWQAHITLLRKLRHPPTTRELPNPLVWPVQEFVLVESQTLPGGAEYRILRRWPLSREHD